MCAPERGDRPERQGDGAEHGRQPVTLTVEPTAIVHRCQRCMAHIRASGPKQTTGAISRTCVALR
jgi:hypothetical protein